MRPTARLFLALFTTAATGVVWGGGETAGPARLAAPPPARPIARSAIGPHALISKNPPMPAPYRPIGWGSNLHEAYGPTYYYPSTKSYEGLHPQYYPFFKPRQWPNYKADPLVGGQCGASRSCWAWDSYDDWMRGGRYGEQQ